MEAVSAGWLLATLAGLAAWSGMSFLVGASLEPGLAGDVAMATGLLRHGQEPRAMQLASAALALCGAAWLARWAHTAWPALWRPAWAAVALGLVGLAFFMPTLGGALLALALCTTQSRWKLATAAAFAAAWILGAFYYATAWPLAHKALLLVGGGAVLGALALWLQRQGPHRGAEAQVPALGEGHLDLESPTQPLNASVTQRSNTTPPAHARWGLAATAVAVLAVANIGIWQKEDLIAHGQPVYLQLAPADPRSLMQGDFMRLNYQLSLELASALEQQRSTASFTTRPQLVARRHASGVLTPLRLHDGTALAADEMRIELSPSHGRWTVVSDAWFFAEGEAALWAAARYAEFRVEPHSGRALLVGLRDATLQALEPPR